MLHSRHREFRKTGPPREYRILPRRNRDDPKSAIGAGDAADLGPENREIRVAERSEALSEPARRSLPAWKEVSSVGLRDNHAARSEPIIRAAAPLAKFRPADTVLGL
jgi:hypothetical protein